MILERVSSMFPVTGKIFPNQSVLQRALTPLLVIPGNGSSEFPRSGHGSKRFLSSYPVSKSIELITNAPRVSAGKEPLQVVTSGDLETERPLTIILSWLMAQKKHLLKYAQFYLNQGFDVLTIRPTPWQLLFPVTGTQVIAQDLLKFLSGNPQYHSTLLHGFSVGGYMFGEVLSLMEQDRKKYQHIEDRIVGQIWDSVVDFDMIPTGLPLAVFPNNAVLRASLERYVRYHLSAFHDVATKHYHRSSAMYHSKPVKAPALFLCSLDDPVANKAAIQRVIDKWESIGTQVYLKCWDSSPHVSHLHHHPQDYKQEMKAFLDKVGLLPYPEKFHQITLSQRN